MTPAVGKSVASPLEGEAGRPQAGREESVRHDSAPASSPVASSAPLPDAPSQNGSEPGGVTDDQSSVPRDQDRRDRHEQKKREKRDVHGWLVLDKPVGMTSTHAVSVVKRLFSAKRAGHAGTLDPLASGCLPIALGEATKTVMYVMDGRKHYRFTVRWGEERDTDDAEGRVVATSEERPSTEAIRALLPRFTGTIEQVPPRFSAIKVEGERAYDIARDGEAVELKARAIDIHRLELLGMPDADHADFAAECGKGAYVRALARDFGRALGCLWPCLRPAPNRRRSIHRSGYDSAGTT